MDVSIFGASGYAGGQLLKLIAKHPIFNLKYAFAETKAGTKISNEHTFLTEIYDQEFESYDKSKVSKDDILLFALPHGQSGKLINDFLDHQIVDLGADFRLKEKDNWHKYYEGDFAGSWVYGLPEIKGRKELITKSKHVANPGCYATVINLSLAPFLQEKLIDLNFISVVGISGTTGAGKKSNQNLLASEVMGSISNYKMGGKHQHIAEIQETLQQISDQEIRVNFNPTLGPFTRGILTNTSLRMNQDLDINELHQIFSRYYEKTHFIKLIKGRNVSTNEVIDTNEARFNIYLDKNTSLITVVGVIDNLIKGAAGQAIQNLNLMNNLDEKLGLS
ncbi:MAG: N-acetyl-gamma-glutamyl-phosphate reductase [Candidatus Nanopelagicales bacterium]